MPKKYTQPIVIAFVNKWQVATKLKGVLRPLFGLSLLEYSLRVISALCLNLSMSKSTMTAMKETLCAESMQTLSHAGLQSVPPGSTVQQVSLPLLGQLCHFFNTWRAFFNDTKA